MSLSIDNQHCSVCGEKAVGVNYFGAFCDEPSHFRVSDRFCEWSQQMADKHARLMREIEGAA